MTASAGTDLRARPQAVKVQVTYADRSVDVVLPAAVPALEYRAEVARSLGAEPSCRWERVGHGPLDPSASLGAQGVGDGDVLVLLAADDSDRLTRFDDLAEAVRAVSAESFPRWRSSGSATVLGLVAATALAFVALLLPALGPVTCVAVGVPTVLLTLALTGVRARTEPDEVGPGEEVVALAVACAHAVAVGAALSAPGPGGWAGAGCGLLVTGALAALCLVRARWAAVVPILLGAAWLGAAVLATGLGVTVGLSLTVAAAGAVLAGRAMPGAILEATVVRGDRGREGAVDVDRVRRDLALAHALVGGGVVVQTLLVFSCLPYLVAAGPVATAWGCALVLLLALRCRHEVLRTHVVLQATCAGLAAGGLVGALALRTDGPVVAVVLLVGCALVATALRGVGLADAPRLAWALDGVERLLVVAVLPGWVLVAGVVPGWPGWS